MNTRTSRLARSGIRCLLLLLVLTGSVYAEDDGAGRAMRLPESLAVTPDGNLIVSWRGDLWFVDDDDSARRLTFHPAEDRRPHVSPDGTQLAFLSNRSGVDQVHVMPIRGGVPRQVTRHSEGARVYGWFPDGRSLLIRSRRDHHWRRPDRFFKKSLDPDEAPELIFDAACGLGAISPDGRRIAFTREGMDWWRKGYRGPRAAQIWLYDIEARSFEKLSAGDHQELWPLWGPGGKELLYVSEEDGTWNLWQRDLSTGAKTQRTHFDDDGVNYPAISADGTHVAFRRLDEVYRMRLGKLKSAPMPATPVDRGDPTLDPVRRDTLKKATAVAFASDAREIAFIAGGDVWVMDTELREPRRVTNTPEEERDPVFGPGFESLYFVSDATGQTDVWRAARADAEKHWWQNESFRVKRLTNDEAVESNLTMTPDGEHLAYVKGRGDLWVMTPEGTSPRRLVESFLSVSYSFAPDGHWVAYSKPDADFNWDVWIRRMDGTGEPVNVSMHPDNDGNPAWSPDGKLLAFTGRRWTDETDICYVWLAREDGETGKRDRTLEKALKKMEGRKKAKEKGKAAGKAGKSGKAPAPKQDPPDEPEPKTPADPLAGTWKGSLRGDPPLPEDGLDVILDLEKGADGYEGTVEVVGQFSGAIESLTFDPADGAFTFALTSPLGPLSGAGTVAGSSMQGSWKIEGVMEGTFEVSRASQGAPETAFRNPKPAAKSAKSKKPDGKKATKPLVPDLDDIAERVQRISIANADERDLLWAPDSKKLAFRATIKGVAGLYTVSFPEPAAPALLSKVNGRGGRWLAAGNQIAWLVNGVPATLSAGGKATSYAFAVRQELHVPSLHAAAFDVAWRTMRDRYYDERLGNRDWDAVRAKYRPMAAATQTPLELQTVVSYMLGELNGSHLGFRVSGAGWKRPGWRDVTGHLGALWDPGFEGPGLRVKEAIRGSPADEKRHRLAAGEIVLSIDGRPIGPATNVDRLLTGDPARSVALRVQGADGATRTVSMHPSTYPAVRRRLYDHGVERARAQVEQASNGRLGYLHIRGMNWSSFLRFEAELYKVGHGKDGLLIDVRDNGGGFTTDHLLTCLTQPRHAITVPRGGGAGYPQDRMIYAPWHKPVVVLCNQNSFSNAEIFAHAIQALKRGPVVGVQTAGGVISTGGTNVMGLGFLRLPFRGWFLAKTGRDMELNGCVPDHVLWPHPADRAAGLDRQLDKAIEVGLAEVEAWRKLPKPKLVPASER